MCGIVGLFGPPDPDRRLAVQGMMDRLAHRGPDGDGLYEDGPVILGHRRLAIIGPGAIGAQPLVDRDSGSALVFNGAIYGYRELADALEVAVDAPERASDTQILFRHLLSRGPEADSLLAGMWAYGFWDGRQNRLILSRDRFGVKPLFWTRWQGQIAFASEIAALLTLPGLSRQMNRDSALGFLTERRMAVRPDETGFVGIQALPAGHHLVLEKPSAGAEISMRSDRWFETVSLCADPMPEDQLRERLEAAVALRLRADTPARFLLSGGLDSSTVLALASRSAARRSPLTAYTLQPRADSTHADSQRDYGLACLVAGHLPEVTLRTVPMPDARTDPDFPQRLIAITEHLAMPLPDGSMVAHDALMAAIAADGGKLVLGGLGGDEALAGYVPEAARALAVDYLWADRFEQARAALGSWRAVLRALPHLPGVTLRNRLRVMRHRARLSSVLSREVLDALPMREQQPAVHPRRLTAMLLEGIERQYLPGFLHYEDHNAMAHGIEARAPFLDPRVIGWGLSAPGSALISGGQGKQALRRIARDLLPAEVADNPIKSGLPAPAADWLAAHPEFVTETLRAGAARLSYLRRGIVEPRAYARLDPVVRWRLFALCLWAERFDLSSS